MDDKLIERLHWLLDNASKMEEWDPKRQRPDGSFYTPQGAYLGESLICLADTYQDHEIDTELVETALKNLPALLAHLDAQAAEIGRLRVLITEALSLKGGWREAIVELEDWCSEPVRLKNMLAAADQLDGWAKQARAALAQGGNADGK